MTPSSTADPIPPDGVLGALLSSTTYGVAACDREGRVVLWNRGCERIFGWSRSEVLGRSLPVIPPEHEETFAGVLEAVTGGDSVEDLTMEHLTRDGGRVDVLLSLRPVRLAPGREPLVLGVATERGSDVDRAALSRRVELLEYRLAETQLPPHFLFNALHAVGSVMRSEDADRAVAMLADLGDVLRHSLRHGPEDTVPLREEVAVLRKYLALERSRFDGDLRVDVDVDPAVEEALVPALVLQPLVENAVKHGLLPAEPPHRLSVRARAEGERLVMTVEDDGVGLAAEAGAAPAERIGLRGTRLRLEHLYGGRHRLRLSDREGPGAAARVEIPLTLPGGRG